MTDRPDKFDFIHEALKEREKNYRFRKLSPVSFLEDSGMIAQKEGKELINFCSNDYLGLSQHPGVIAQSVAFANKYGAGSGASRLVSGTLDIHHELEMKLARVFDSEAALVFNSGFQANTSIISAIADRNSLILADKKCHNSLIQGAILSRAEFKRFNHNDYSHLRSLLEKAAQKNYNRVIILSETVFSMDGDRSDLVSLQNLVEDFNAILYSDDAHAVGVLGKQGLGLNYAQPGVDLSLGTFGKAFGSFGAFLCCSAEVKDYLINFCPGFIYTTASPPAIIGAIDAAMDLIPEMENEREFLFQKVEHVKEKLKSLGYDTGESDSQIIPVIIGSEEETIKLSGFLEEQGIWASAIRPPTVEEGTSRIRITLSALHTQKELEKLIRAFREWKKR